MTKRAKADIWMPLYIDDYLGDTTLLTVEQHGAYLLLLMSMWRNGGWLPDADGALAMASKLGRNWRKHRDLLAPFFTVEEGRWTHKRLTKELEKAERMAATSRENGRLGGRPKNREQTQQDTQEEPAGYSPGFSGPSEAETQQVTRTITRQETPARVEGGRSVATPYPIQEVSSDSEVSSGAEIIPLDGRAGR